MSKVERLLAVLALSSNLGLAGCSPPSSEGDPSRQAPISTPTPTLPQTPSSPSEKYLPSINLADKGRVWLPPEEVMGETKETPTPTPTKEPTPTPFAVPISLSDEKEGAGGPELPPWFKEKEAEINKQLEKMLALGEESGLFTRKEVTMKPFFADADKPNTPFKIALEAAVANDQFPQGTIFVLKNEDGGKDEIVALTDIPEGSYVDYDFGNHCWVARGEEGELRAVFWLSSADNIEGVLGTTAETTDSQNEPHFYINLQEENLEIYSQWYGVPLEELKENLQMFNNGIAEVNVKPRRAPVLGVGLERDRQMIMWGVEPIYFVFDPNNGKELWHEPNLDAWMLAGHEKVIFAHRLSPLGNLVQEEEDVFLKFDENTIRKAHVIERRVISVDDQQNLLQEGVSDPYYVLITCYLEDGKFYPSSRSAIWMRVD